MQMRQIALFSVTAIALGACANGNPQNDEIRAIQTLALTKVTTASDEARQEFTDGMNEFDFLRSDEAYEHFKRAIAADPNFALAELYAARAASTAGSASEVNAHLKRAVELSKNASEIERLEIEADNALNSGNTDDAVKIATRMTEIDPKGARSWRELYDAYSAAGDEPKARTALEKAIEVAPQLAFLHGLISASYVQSEPSDYVKGEQAARKAVELAPNEAAAHDVLGDAVRAQGKLEDAAVEYTKQAELDPTQGDGYQQRAHVNSFLGRYKEARADYDAATAATTGNRKPGLAMYRAHVHLFEGNPKAAVEELAALDKAVDGMNIPGALSVKRLIIGEESFIAFHFNMIPELERATAEENAIWAEQQKQLNTPDFTRQAAFNMALNEGYVAAAKGDYAAAKAKAAEAKQIRQVERNAAKDQPVHALLATIALKEKRWADVIKELDQASPQNRYGWYQRALALEELKQGAEAQKYYQMLANFYFNDPAIAIVRNEVLKKVGKAS